MSNDFKERYQSILDTVSAYNIPMQPGFVNKSV